MKWLTRLLVLLFVGAVAFFALGPPLLERSLNRVLEHDQYVLREEAVRLHASLVVGDLHADSTLWNRDLRERADRGHVDLPRLRAGNVALQSFTFVTKTPAGMNIESNDTDARDNVTLLAVLQRWPASTWSSLTQRALHQAEKLVEIEASNPGELKVLRSRDDVDAVMQARAAGSNVVGAMMGIEGAHALDGKLENIERLIDAGVRMYGLHHFFDNALGGSLHGAGGGGLSNFGEEVVLALDQQGMIIDVAHSSEQSVRDVLALIESPLIVSHTGFRGHCDTSRNISDALMLELANRGSLIGVGYWKEAVCDVSPSGIVAALRYGIDLLGVDHVALGSDYDGTVTTTFAADELAILTQSMIDAEFTEREIRQVMGGNMLRFLRENLPASD